MYGYFPVSNDRNDGATTRKKRQPLLIEHRESRYAILGYEIRYIYLLRESGTKERSFDSNRLSWNSIGLRFSSHERLSSECSAPLCHWYSGRRKLTRSSRVPSTLSGEDERKTKIWIGLVHFHPRGITMLSYLRSASLEIVHGSDELEKKSREEKCFFYFLSSTIAFLIQSNDFSESAWKYFDLCRLDVLTISKHFSKLQRYIRSNDSNDLEILAFWFEL